MAVHIRLSRSGSKKRPFYRLLVTDHRSPRGGRFIENIGTFDPSRKGGEFIVNFDRYNYWKGVGAVPSATVADLVKRSLAGGQAVAAPAAK